MDHFLLIIRLLIFLSLNSAATADTNTSVTQTTWFWPLLSICLALLLSVPCTLIAVVVFCCNKKHLDDSDESSASSNSVSSSSSSSSPVHHRRTHHHARPQRSHFAGGFRSPPPPYTTNEQPENLFITPSLPPPYESHSTANDSRSATGNPTTTIVNVEPTESIQNQSSDNPRVGTPLDLSTTLTNQSIQTFQV